MAMSFQIKSPLGNYPASKNSHKSEPREESMSKDIKYSISPE